MNKVLFFILICFTLNTKALVLGEKAVFHRCYKSLTQTFPHPNNTFLKQVEAGSISAVDACSQILDKALFSVGTTQLARVDEESKKVLRTMHNVHFSWFTNQTIPTLQPYMENTKSFLDINGPALHYTRALFDTGFTFDKVFNGKTHYESLRTDMDPSVSPIVKQTKSDFPRLYPPFQFSPQGELLGVRPHSGKIVNYSELAGGKRVDSVFTWNLHLGGGILGSNMYLMQNFGIGGLFKSDGTKKMPRSYAMNLISDFLCREIPVIRLVDTQAFVVNNSQTEFRRDGACLRCHQTIDRTSAVIRNMHFKGRLMGIDPGELQRHVELNLYATTKESETSAWSDIVDVDYYKRPAKGHFTYRTHSGELISRPLTNLEDLGNTLKNMEDTYICMAKRYYHYFTGIDVNLDDITDPDYPLALSPREIAHRNEVIEMGKSFKVHADPLKLIKEILSKKQYKESDFKIPSN